MSALDDQLGQFSILAIETAARELGIDPLTLARRLNQAEIARLIHLLNACLVHVDHPGLRHRTEDLLMAVTDGRMPDKRPESELDWALKVTRRRRSPADGHLDTDAEKEE
ncbi:MAG: hypothetical protein P8Z36_13285 [Gemmatimonadota bacterium]